MRRNFFKRNHPIDWMFFVWALGKKVSQVHGNSNCVYSAKKTTRKLQMAYLCLYDVI